MSETTKILFIGNSFTNRNDLPAMIARLGASASPPKVIETDRVVANGMALKTHWDRGEALAAIWRQPWDFVSLQEQSTLPFKNRARFHEYVERFDSEIKRHGARTVVYLTWARLATPERQAELTEACISIGEQLGALVAPVGVAWEKVLKDHPEIVLHDKDGSHPNPTGTYLAACVFYAALFGQNPVGLPAVIPKLDPAVQRILQEQAWDAVRSHQGRN